MDLFKALTAINETKVNLFNTGEPEETLSKGYSAFMVNRMLSYHADAILLVNEMNTRMGTKIEITPKQHFEFLLNTLSKKKRFTRTIKPEADEKIELIMSVFKYNRDRAREICDLVSDSDFERMRTAFGGKQ